MIKFSNIANKRDRNSLIEANASNLKELQAAISDGNTSFGKEIKAEMDKIQEQIDLIDSLGDVAISTGKKEQADGEKKDSTAKFANLARRMFQNTVTGMREGANADGGYTVPEDIKTSIEKYRDSKYSLLKEIDVKQTTTNKGSRTRRVRGRAARFAKVSELAAFTKGTAPTFERYSYEIEKYGAWFPVSNELFQDSDANITAELIEWFGDGMRETDNYEILSLIQALDANGFTTLDQLQRLLFVGLGGAYRGTSKVYTNDDGVLWLSQLKDKNENYLLKAMNNDPLNMILSAGAMAVKVENVGNESMPSDISTADKRIIPFEIGDLKEAVRKMDRQQMTIFASNTASVTGFNAFEQDATLFRPSFRADYLLRDSNAVKHCTLEVADTTVTGTSVTDGE